jgi:RNA polymerase subunit RPABC4/transcription elongation factor Spt4
LAFFYGISPDHHFLDFWIILIISINRVFTIRLGVISGFLDGGIMRFDPTFLSGFTLVLTGFTGAFIVALWVALVIWTFRDIRARHRDRLVHFLAAALVALLNLPGVLVYLVLRPSRTLEEEYQQTLEEEALLQSIEDQSVCPGCERRIKEDWMVCPTCQTKLRKPCHSCGRLMELPWNICPYCGVPAPGMRKEGGTMDDVVRGLQPEEDIS